MLWRPYQPVLPQRCERGLAKTEAVAADDRYHRVTRKFVEDLANTSRRRARCLGTKPASFVMDVLWKGRHHEHPSRFRCAAGAGLAASGQGRGDEAVRLFQQASAVAPASGVPHFLIGSEYASRGQVHEAELAFSNAVLLAPGFVLARYQLGLLQFTSQRAAAALLTWEPLLALPADQPLPHFVRGFAALAQDLHREALAHYRAGLACPTDNPALFEDIQRVVDAVQQLAAGAGGEPQAAHVLLSGYARGLH
ncbi:hypothetical protein HK414_02640 [Ramlibacter terrae]|uniref:Tetratricopeptide repeat protein n=1 Tax=Ramlibacter terrae TaxID=2732511 RepID=A0ABX6P1Q6_9BURK|nr:hypothetical protein HK414_02640 [Ramlibacter terrae]